MKEEIDEVLKKIDKLDKTDFEAIYNECVKLYKFMKNKDDREYITYQSDLFDRNINKIKWIVVGPKDTPIWWDEFGTNLEKLSKEKKEELFRASDNFEKFLLKNKREVTKDGNETK